MSSDLFSKDFCLVTVDTWTLKVARAISPHHGEYFNTITKIETFSGTKLKFFKLDKTDKTKIQNVEFVNFNEFPEFPNNYQLFPKETLSKKKTFQNSSKIKD